MAASGAHHRHEPPETRPRHFAKLGTSDLRVDTHFTFSSEVMRPGSRVIHTRTALHGAAAKLLTTASTTCITA